ncbi:MAG: murein biosynthesis integral membrane protein MurJ [Spirochaetaceae bacterium]
MSKEKKLKKSAILSLIFLTFGSRILGLVREIMKARFIGGSILNDAFNVAFAIPNVLRRLFAEASMTAAFIPTFKGLLKSDNSKNTKDFLNSIFTILTFLVTLTVIIGIIITPLIYKFVDTKNADITELVFLTRIMFPYLAFVSIAALLQGVLNSLNIFAPGGFVPILWNVIVITTTLLLSKVAGNPARAMAIGVTVGGLIQMVYQLPFVLKNGFSFKFVKLRNAFKNSGTKNVGRLIAPTLLSMGAYQLSTLVANFVSLATGEGVNSALIYSLRLQELVLGIFVVSIGTILISTLSKDAKDLNWDSFSSSLELSLGAITLITIPISIFAFIYSYEIVELIYFRGKFGLKELEMTAGVFRYHISGLFFIAVTRITNPAFFAMEDSRTPAKLGIISLLIGTILMFTLAPIMGGNGIALAVIISSFIQMLLSFIFLNKKDNINFKRTIKTLIPTVLKIVIATTISIYPLIKTKSFLLNLLPNQGEILRIGVPFILSALLFFIIYFALLFIFKDKTLKRLLKLAKKR